MSSTKRKRKPSSKSTTPASAEPELNLGACAPCKQAKSRCHFVSKALICSRCQTKGFRTECVIVPPKPRTRGTRSNSIDSSLPSKSGKAGNQPSGIVNIPGSSKQRKRSHSDTSSLTSRPAKHPRLQVASQSSHSRQTTLALDSIVEEDESQVDTLVADFADITEFPERDHTRLIRKSKFIDALAGSDHDYDEGLRSGDSDSNMEEEVDIVISSDSGSSSEDEDEGLSLSQPVKRQLPSHSHTMKSIKTQSNGSTKSQRIKHKPNTEDTYNPSTCPFDISGVVRCPDGNNSPITLPSTESLDNLRIAVAQKLERFPGLVMLQYRLSSDNAKIGAISIKTNEEFQFFKERLRQMIVPPRLANGKASSRTPKPVLVYFEDASIETKETPTSSGSASKKNTRTAPGPASRQTTTPSTGITNGQTELQATKMQIINQLQSKWRCTKHSKDHDIYCYSIDGNICYTLTHGNLTFWALEVMEGNTTIEEKPATLNLHNVRPSSRASTPRPPDQMGFPGPYTMVPGMYGYPQGPISMPMWGYPGSMPPPPGQYFGTQLPMMNAAAATMTQTMSTSGSTITSNSGSNTTPVVFPDIVAWFAYLDQHEERNKDGILFAPYGVRLKTKGFLRISQLTLDFIQLKDLQDWLGIEVGTAILIMQYAKEDVEALKSRKWVFPG